jgi:hypothetical protein
MKYNFVVKKSEYGYYVPTGTGSGYLTQSGTIKLFVRPNDGCWVHEEDAQQAIEAYNHPLQSKDEKTPSGESNMKPYYPDKDDVKAVFNVSFLKGFGYYTFAMVDKTAVYLDYKSMPRTDCTYHKDMDVVYGWVERFVDRHGDTLPTREVITEDEVSKEVSPEKINPHSDRLVNFRRFSSARRLSGAEMADLGFQHTCLNVRNDGDYANSSLFLGTEHKWSVITDDEGKQVLIATKK